MKKKQIANIIMAAIILMIAAAGILVVGYIQGWFDRAEDGDALLTRVTGIVNIEREGVAYRPEKDTVLRENDRLTTSAMAKATISIGESYLVLNQNTTLTVKEVSKDGLQVEVTSGEVFGFTTEETQTILLFHHREVPLNNAAALLSVRAGAESIYVFSGSVTAEDQTAHTRQMLSWVGEDLEIHEFGIQSLNDFTLEQIRIANEIAALCFTNADLDQLESERLAAMQELLDQKTEPSDETKETNEAMLATVPSETQPASDDHQSRQETTPPMPPAEATAPKETEPVETAPSETTTPPETEPKAACTIAIRCDTILNNWDDLDPAKAGFVPGDGCILATVSVEFTEGETVFDVLKRVCSTYGIPLEYSWTPLYNSYYIEGINNLYEFDCGSQSGWMFKVNGWFPNYGCSGYALEDGDAIVWCYTCKGLGADVG